jgi:hypothetical protein
MTTADMLFTFFQFLMLALVVYRVTRFVAADAFPLIAVPREWIIGKLGEDHWFSYLITCMWCASVYISAATVAVFNHYVSVPMPYAQAIAASALTGYLAMREPEVS